MKNQFSPFRKKLNKKQLQSIAGGMYNCMVPELPADINGCTMIHPRCGQEICRPQI